MSKLLILFTSSCLLAACLAGCATSAAPHPQDEAALAYNPHARRIRRRVHGAELQLPQLPTSPDEIRRRLALSGVSDGEATGLPPRVLEVVSVNTKERLAVTLFESDGLMKPESITDLTYMLRDWRREEEHRPPPRLLTLLYLVAQHYQQPLHLVSGYRHPKRPGSGSRHGIGCAADFYIDGVEPAELADFVRSSFEQVGVGYYPNSGFVHLDVRDASYYWIDHSGPGQPQRHQPIEVSPVPPKGSDWTVHSSDLPAAYLGSR